jgi:hypothetical protein
MSADPEKCARPSLPVELYRLIASHLDSTDAMDRMALFSLCLVSRTWFNETLPILYTTIHPKTVNQCMSFLETVVENPARALLVRSFTHDIRYTDSAFYRDETVPRLSRSPLELRFLNLLIEGLKAMRNLKQLSLSGYIPSPDDDTKVDILDGCTFQLEHLAYDARYSDIPLFLGTQTHLRILELPSWTTEPPSPKYYGETCHTLELPTVTKLITSQYGMRYFMPICKVTTLCWIPDLDDNEEIGDLAFPFSRLTALRIGGYFGRVPLQLLSPYLGQLTLLHLVTLHVCSSFTFPPKFGAHDYVGRGGESHR